MTTIDTTTGRTLPEGETSRTAVTFDPNTERYDPVTGKVVPRTPDRERTLAYKFEQLQARVAAHDTEIASIKAALAALQKR